MTKAVEKGALDRAMDLYKAKVIAARCEDPKTGAWRCPFRVCKGDVLKLAGIKSRSTLSAPEHDILRTVNRRGIRPLFLG